MPKPSPHDEDASTSSGAHTVVFVGDSITAGEVSADWVSRIRVSNPGWTCENAGVNGDLAWNVRQRLNSVIEQDPEVVVLLIGTNDVASAESPALLQRLERIKKLPLGFAPSRTAYVEDVRAIVRDIRAKSQARVIVVDIPPLGEDLSGPVNRRVGEYNAALHRLAEAEGFACVPLYERLAAEIPHGHRPRPYSYRKAPMAMARLQRTVLGRSWDEISRRNGLVVLTDWVHLNGRAAAILAGLVAGELKEGFS